MELTIACVLSLWTGVGPTVQSMNGASTFTTAPIAQKLEIPPNRNLSSKQDTYNCFEVVFASSVF
jgi:hypothetical protein